MPPSYPPSGKHMTSRAVYLCPLCEQELQPIGFCHLICPAGHYQEVCSDLFMPDRIESDRASDPALKRQAAETKSRRDSNEDH